MATRSLDAQIQNYLPLLGKEEKQSILSQIKSFLIKKETTKRMTKDEFIIQYNKELEKAENEVKVGFFISQEDLEKESETW